MQKSRSRAYSASTTEMAASSATKVWLSGNASPMASMVSLRLSTLVPSSLSGPSRASAASAMAGQVRGRASGV